MDLHELAAAFPDASGYLDTATMGIPPHASLAAMRRHLDDWAAGRCDAPAFDHDVARARRAYARLADVRPEQVSIAAQLSVITGTVASSLPDGARVLAAEEDFTSVLFPFLADERLNVRIVPLDQLFDHLTAAVDLVAVSAVQSADGRRIDLDHLAMAARDASARTFVDVTQAAGWTPLGAGRFDVTACSGYKWLCSPRGTAFMTIKPEGTDWLVPRHAGWYAGDDPWTSIYRPPLRLADDARRFDISPAWIAWVGAAPALEVLADTGTDVIEAHDVGLANELRERLGMSPSNSSIVSLDLDLGDAADPLAEAGIRCAARAGRARLGFHCYNTLADVDRVVEALR